MSRSLRSLCKLFAALSFPLAACVAAQGTGEKMVGPGQVVIANDFTSDFTVRIERADGSKDNLLIPSHQTRMVPCGASCTVVMSVGAGSDVATVRRIVGEQKRYLLFVDEAHKRVDIGEVANQSAGPQ